MRYIILKFHSKKLILSQFPQKEITIFFYENKNKKRKKGKSNLQFVSPTFISKKVSLMDLFWEGNEKICDFWLNLAICQNLFSLILQSTNQVVPFFLIITFLFL